MPDATSLLRAGAAARRRGRSRSQHYVEVRAGVMTPPVHRGKIAVWPSDELEAITRAEIAGASDDELRVLVQRLVEARAAGRPRLAA